MMEKDKCCEGDTDECKHLENRRSHYMLWLMKASSVLFSIWLVIALFSSMAVNGSLSEAQAAQGVTQAEHERLRAEMEQRDAAAITTEKILEQRVLDDERQIAINTAILQDLSNTIHRAEGLGLSLGLVITIVQFVQLQAWLKNKQRVRVTDLME